MRVWEIFLEKESRRERGSLERHSKELQGDFSGAKGSICWAWEGGQLKKKDGLLISGHPSWRLFSSMSIVDFSFASNGKLLFFCFCWLLDDVCWLGVNMLLSLFLMIFIEDPFGSVSVSPWEICDHVLFFYLVLIWFHPPSYELIDWYMKWVCMSSSFFFFFSIICTLFLLSTLFLVPIPGMRCFSHFCLCKQGVTADHFQ